MPHGSLSVVEHGSGSRLDGEVVELDLLLTSDEATVLESAAQAHGTTVAHLLRTVIREGLARWRSPLAQLESGHGSGS